MFPLGAAFALLTALGVGAGFDRSASQEGAVSTRESRAAEPPRRAPKTRESEPATKFFQARRSFRRAATNGFVGETATTETSKTQELASATARTSEKSGPSVGGIETFGTVAPGFEIELEFGVATDEFPLAVGPSVAVENELPAACSAWARFAPGSWARFRTTSVAYENGKASQSVTENRITLRNVDYERKFYELQYDGTIKMGGVDRPRASETLRFDFWDVPIDGEIAVEPLAPVNLLIAGKAIPCQTRRLTRTTANGTETTTLWFSPVVAPYVLQKETTREHSASENGGASASASSRFRELSLVQKTAANLLLGRNFSSYTVASSAQNGRFLHSKTAERSTAVPGGVVRETTVQTNEKGAVLYRSTTVLLDYYAAF